MTAPLSTDQSSCLPTEEEQRAGLTIRGSLPSNPNNVEPYIWRFICAVYPSAPNLALASFSEEKALTDAADEIERLQRYAEECREKFNAEYKATQHLLAQIERLKLGGSDVCATCHAHCVVIEDHMQTIDRLQRELTESLDGCERWAERNRQLVTERDRLRAALEKIVDSEAPFSMKSNACQTAIDALRGADETPCAHPRYAQLTSLGPRQCVACVAVEEAAVCNCPEVCKVCGGRVATCEKLGHRTEGERSVKWHECPAVETGGKHEG